MYNRRHRQTTIGTSINEPNMPDRPRPTAPSAEQLAQLFVQLHRLEVAGIPAFGAFALLGKTEKNLSEPLNELQRQLRMGKPIAEAGFNAGIFNSTQRTLIHAAESSGTLTKVYKQLADYYQGLARRIQKIKSRLYFPAIVLIIALFVQPIAALATAKIGLGVYLQMSLGKILTIAASLFIGLRLPYILSRLGFESLIHELQFKTPLLGQWIVKRQLNEFFFILGMMLEAGLAFSEALPKAVASIKNSVLRKYFQPALALMSTGASVAEALAKVSVIKPVTIQVINSSEQSGKLAGSVLHAAKIESETISLQDDAIAEWLPRLVYTLIAIWMAYSIIGSQFGTMIPKDL
jgi:type II secretory pathway component PulF